MHNATLFLRVMQSSLASLPTKLHTCQCIKTCRVRSNLLTLLLQIASTRKMHHALASKCETHCKDTKSIVLGVVVLLNSGCFFSSELRVRLAYACASCFFAVSPYPCLDITFSLLPPTVMTICTVSRGASAESFSEWKSTALSLSKL
ncbi:hypothetical protein EI94DRAFT_795704 [Lactarius quietus]|nr:hypothetical protein EI94DRAFT_795704 [Lactarius quietus]